jgi:hypothetical protein
MRGERNCALAYFEAQRLTRELKATAGEKGASITTNSLRWMPSAYFYQNQLAFAQMYGQCVLPLVNMTNRTVSISAYHTVEADINARMKHYSPYTAQALRMFPAVGKSVLKFALIQGDLDLARVACALERYHLAHGVYPETLAALAPQYITAVPSDLINGQPLHYRRTNGLSAQSPNGTQGSFVLYSVGWNGKDDGGVVALAKSGRLDSQQGDWVWKY